MADADSGQISRQEIEAVVETRHELGPSYEAEIVDSFAERIEQAIETRAGTQLARAQSERSEAGQRQKQQFVLGIVSLGTGIPITAIAAAITDLPGLDLPSTWVARGRHHDDRALVRSSSPTPVT